MNSVKLAAADQCPVSFIRFAAPVITGTIVSTGAAALTRKVFKTEHADTANTAATAVRIGAFWIAAGLTWVLMTRRP